MQSQVRSQILPPQTVKKHVKNRPRNLKTPEFTVLKRKLSSLSPSTVIDVSRIENQDSVYRHAIKKQSVVVLVAKFFTANIEQQEKMSLSKWSKNPIDVATQKYKYFHT